MNKTELVAALAEKAEVSKKDAEKVLNAFVETVQEERAVSSFIPIPEIAYGSA